MPDARPRLPGVKPMTPPAGLPASPFDTAATAPEEPSPLANPFAPESSTTSTLPGTGSLPHRPSPMPLPAPRPTPMPGQLQAEAARLATPPPGALTMPVPGMPGAVPVVMAAPDAMAGGTLVSHGAPSDLAAPDAIAGSAVDVTERVRVPTPIPARDDTAFVRPPRSKLPLIIGLGVAVAGAVIAVIVIGGSGGSSSSSTGSAQEPAADRTHAGASVDQPAADEPAAKPTAATPTAATPAAADPADETPEPVEKDPGDKPIADKAVADKPVADKPVDAKPVPAAKPPVVVKKPPPPVVKTPPAVVKSPVKRPPAKTDKKEPTWNADSPFMPVRTDKK